MADTSDEVCETGICADLPPGILRLAAFGIRKPKADVESAFGLYGNLLRG